MMMMNDDDDDANNKQQYYFWPLSTGLQQTLSSRRSVDSSVTLVGQVVNERRHSVTNPSDVALHRVQCFILSTHTHTYITGWLDKVALESLYFLLTDLSANCMVKLLVGPHS